MNKLQIRSHLALLSVSLIFGVNYWVSKSLMPDYLNPFQLLLLRSTGSLVIIWIIQLYTRKEKVLLKDMGLMAMCGLFGIALNQGLFFIGLNKTSPFDASIIHTANPILVMLIAAILLKEKITFVKSAGIFLGLSGALFLVLTSSKSASNVSSYTGNLFIFANGVAYAIYLVMVKPLMEKYNIVTVLKWIFLFGFLFSIPFITMSSQQVIWSNFSIWQWSSLAYIIIVNSFLAYFLIVFALKQVTATLAGYYAYLQTLVVAAIGIIIGAEFPTWIKVFSGLLIFTGVYLVSRKKKI